MDGTPALRVWALVDPRAGTANQCLGVADALGLPYEAKSLAFTVAGRLPNVLRGASLAGLDDHSRAALVPPWPDLVIAAGRRAAPVARAIKRASGAFLVQVMHPGYAGAGDFDLIATPRHDRRKPAPNLLEIIGAAHRISGSRLAEAAAAWRDRLAGLAMPRIALIVGGGTRRRAFTPAMAADLAALADTMARDAGGSLLVSTSRRTGRAAADALFAGLGVPHFGFRWGDDGENPYMGFLATAEAIVVTGESVSMCAEACATERPVYIHAPEPLITAKHARLHDDLYAGGFARPLAGRYEDWRHPPLDPARQVAAEIRRRLNLTDP